MNQVDIGPMGLISESPLVLSWSSNDSIPVHLGTTTGFDPLVWSGTLIVAGGQDVPALVGDDGIAINGHVPFAQPPSNLSQPSMQKLTTRLAEIRSAAGGDPQKLIAGMTGYQEFNMFTAPDASSGQHEQSANAAVLDQLAAIRARLDQVAHALKIDG